MFWQHHRTPPTTIPDHGPQTFGKFTVAGLESQAMADYSLKSNFSA
jgi:hypothetical protein